MGDTPRSDPRTAGREAARLAALQSSGLLDRDLPEGLAAIIRAASRVTGAPVTALTVVSEYTLVIVSAMGLEPFVSDRSTAFCNHTIHHPEGLVVHDAREDERFATRSLVADRPELRSYAGVPVHVGGHALGALCLMSESPAEFGEQDLETLGELAGLAEQALELRWRRLLASPPPIEEIEELAALLERGDDVDTTIGSLSRPAVVFDRNSLQFVHVNEAAVRRYGWSRTQFLDMTLLDVKPVDASQVMTSVREDLARGGEPYWDGRETTHCDSEGRAFPVALRLADFDLAGRPCRLAIMTDISAHQALSAAVEQAANFDPLTTFGNRRFLMSQLEQISDSDGRAAVLMIDLDQFKAVNDVVGHERGDEIIVAASARIARDLPAGSIPTRYGGDSFVVIVPDIGGDEGLVIAENIRCTLGGAFGVGSGEFWLTASVGVTFTEAGVGPTELLGRADGALADAKRLGRNRVVLADSTTRAQQQRRSQLGQEVKTAIDDDQFELWYQTIVELCVGDVFRVDRVEALVRWRHPTRGIVAPGGFLDLVEGNGLMRELNRIVFAHACRAAADFRAQGRDLQINVNCSAKQFNLAMIDDIDRAVAAQGVAHSDLRLEVTETAFSREIEEIDKVIAALRERAIPLVIDDFGAGHSSLGRLADLLVQGLKLDGSFVSASSHPRGSQMLRAIFDLARAADLPITAEGIETRQQLDLVTEIGFDFGQGYLFARPAPLGELELTVRLGD